ncbi:MAG: DUF4442 domain-containing protein [Sulfitobacter sp.]
MFHVTSRHVTSRHDCALRYGLSDLNENGSEMTMTPYDMIKAHLDIAVPFATFVGVTLLEIGDGHASAELEQRDEVSNHIKSMHAGAMFTLGEAASGAAMAGALAPVILEMRPVAAVANISFKKVAIGKLTAYAKTSETGEALMQSLKQDGKVAFDVLVDIQDASGDTVVDMTVNWHVSAKR